MSNLSEDTLYLISKYIDQLKQKKGFCIIINTIYAKSEDLYDKYYKLLDELKDGSVVLRADFIDGLIKHDMYIFPDDVEKRIKFWVTQELKNKKVPIVISSNRHVHVITSFEREMKISEKTYVPLILVGSIFDPNQFEITLKLPQSSAFEILDRISKRFSKDEVFLALVRTTLAGSENLYDRYYETVKKEKGQAVVFAENSGDNVNYNICKLLDDALDNILPYIVKILEKKELPVMIYGNENMYITISVKRRNEISEVKSIPAVFAGLSFGIIEIELIF